MLAAAASAVRQAAERRSVMDDNEAIQLLEGELARFRPEPYAELVRRIEEKSTLEYEQAAASGAKYQVEIQFLWDDQPGGNALVMGSIDDGGWRAFLPLSRSFIKSPDGSFVGE